VRAIRFLGSVLATVRFVRPTNADLVLRRRRRLWDCTTYLPASTTYDYIKHTHEMSRVNGATNAFSIGPSMGYTLFFVFVHILLLFTTYMSSDTHMHIHVVTYITLVFWIKLKLKMPISLTIQKPDIRHFSVSGFAVALKPSEPFDGAFYKDGVVR
jgi:hypothetical protein